MTVHFGIQNSTDICIYIYIYIYTVKPLYKKNLFIRNLFTYLVGIQPFPH